MTPIEIFAAIFAVIILIKLVQFLFMKPKTFMKWVDKMFKKTTVLPYFYLALAAVLLHYLLKSLTIVQIIAVSFFTLSLLGFTLLLFPKGYVYVAKEIIANRNKALVTFIPWVALSIWTLYMIFA